MTRIQIVTHNMFRKLSSAGVQEDINRYLDASDLVFFQEAQKLNNSFFPNNWELYHPTLDTREAGAIAWRRNIGRVVDKGSPLLYEVPSRRTRYFQWVTLQIDSKVITFTDVHLPEKGFVEEFPTSYTEAMDSIVKFYRDRKNTMVMGGDWNKINGGGIESRTNAIFKGAHIDGFAYSPNLALNNVRTIENSVTNTDHVIVQGTLDTANVKDDPDEPADNDDGRRNLDMRVVTSNIKVSMPSAQVKQDAAWIKENFKPDLWLTQETNHHHDELRAVQDYGFFTPKNNPGIGIQSKSILWNQKTMEFVGGRGFKLNWDPPNTRHWNDIALWMNMVHLKPRKAKALSIYGFSFHTYVGIAAGGHPRNPTSELQKAATAAWRKIGEVVQDYANKENSVVFWGGDLNVNWTADGGKSKIFPVSIFHEHGMRSIYDMIDERALTVDVVGTHLKAIKRVNAHGWRLSPASVHSDHRFGLATFTIKGVRNDSTGGDDDEEPSPETPEPEPTPIPHQEFEADEGHSVDIDHTECCGLREVP